MRPFGVVVDSPRLDAFARVDQREQPAGIETLGPDTGIEGGCVPGNGVGGRGDPE